MSEPLTQDERDQLEVGAALIGWSDRDEAAAELVEAVESIVAARVQALTAERDEARTAHAELIQACGEKYEALRDRAKKAAAELGSKNDRLAAELAAANARCDELDSQLQEAVDKWAGAEERIDKALALVEQWEAARDYWSDVANETEDVEKRLRQLAVASRYSDQITTLRAALAADTPTGTINDDDQEARR